MSKVNKALKEYTPYSLMLAGGVAANKALRQSFMEAGHAKHIPVFVPDFEFTGDNAAMIAMTGYYRRKQASKNTWKTLEFDPQLPFIV
jgi:N6-L-threonylcarbamoyladenine synthase